MYRCIGARSALRGMRQSSAGRGAQHARAYSAGGGRDQEAGHARHKEFSERFMDILRNAKVEPPKPGVADIGAAEADARLAEELRALFRKSPVTVTPELLEQRRRLRSEYPELFKDISDKDLDG